MLRGPLKGLSCHSISRSGELSTFDERLHEVRDTGPHLSGHSDLHMACSFKLVAAGVLTGGCPWQAVQNGDAMTVGQAWQDVKAGTVKADDIDTLNTLLKYDHRRSASSQPTHSQSHATNAQAINTAPKQCP